MNNRRISPDKLIKEKFSASFMNDSKWVKVIQTLVDNHELIRQCDLKLIYDDKIRQLMVSGDEQFDFDFYNNSMESMVTDPVVPGWTLYKEIEWISFPKLIMQNDKEYQDIEKIHENISIIGQFSEEINEDYYKIYAYR